MPIDAQKLRKLADALDCSRPGVPVSHEGSTVALLNVKRRCPLDIGEVNVLIREVTTELLEHQNINRKAAEALVEAAYQAGA